VSAAENLAQPITLLIASGRRLICIVHKGKQENHVDEVDEIFRCHRDESPQQIGRISDPVGGSAVGTACSQNSDGAEQLDRAEHSGAVAQNLEPVGNRGNRGLDAAHFTGASGVMDDDDRDLIAPELFSRMVRFLLEQRNRSDIKGLTTAPHRCCRREPCIQRRHFRRETLVSVLEARIWQSEYWLLASTITPIGVRRLR
jgi:hypothetical protein